MKKKVVAFLSIIFLLSACSTDFSSEISSLLSNYSFLETSSESVIEESSKSSGEVSSESVIEDLSSSEIGEPLPLSLDSSSTINEPSLESSTNLSISSPSSENSQESISLSSESYVSSYSSSIEDDGFKWNIDTELRGVNFRNELKKLIDKERTRTTTYSNCLGIGAKAAAYPNKTSLKFVPFYHGTTTTTSTSGCNREHTWPKSRGTGESGPGADPFIIRPTLTSDNSSRGNLFYGTAGKSGSEWDPGSLGYEPSRGEAARIILYTATAYYDYGFSLSNNPYDATSLKTMGTLKYLIQWNRKYAPTQMEIQINEYLHSQGYGRNPFVDNPEFAEYIWSENGLVGTSNTGNDDLPKYDLVDAIDDIDGLKLAIITKDSGGNAQGLTTSTKSAALPWYFVGVACTLSADYKQMSTSYEALAFFDFREEQDGTFTIQNGNNYLYNYIEDTHYSIGLGNTPINGGSIYWYITTKSDGSFIFYGERGVYLEFYNGSFCGYSKEPLEGIYLYK